MRGHVLVAESCCSLCGSELRRAATQCSHQLRWAKLVRSWRSMSAWQGMHGSGIPLGLKCVSPPPASISPSATALAMFTPCSCMREASSSRSYLSSAKVSAKEFRGLIGLMSGAHDPHGFDDRAWQNLRSYWHRWIF